MATNYAFGGGQIKSLAQPSQVAAPKLTQGTQDRVTGVTNRPGLQAGERPDFGPTSEELTKDLREKSGSINDFGERQTYMKKMGLQIKQTKEKEAAAAEQKRQADAAAAAAKQRVATSRPGAGKVSSGGVSQPDYSNYSGPNNRQSHGVPGGPGSNVIGVDCSGLTSYAYSQIGITIPHKASKQMTLGYKTAAANLQPGDLVVWNNGKHTAMYMGNGQIVESVPSTGPRVSAMPSKGVTGVHIKLPGV